jgi:hypothetical protein
MLSYHQSTVALLWAVACHYQAQQATEHHALLTTVLFAVARRSLHVTVHLSTALR